jgi:ankyrin repeat protein
MLTVQASSLQTRDIVPSPILPCRKRKLIAKDEQQQQQLQQCDRNKKPSLLSTANEISLNQMVNEIFTENGYTINDAQLSLLSHKYFAKPSPAQIAAYSIETIKAVRVGDINELRRLYMNGVSFDCCNQYGESLVSMVCRKGNTEVVRFLVKEANVSLFICDDFGRTVLHDACWTVEPSFGLMEFLLEEIPDLLLVKDVRGHTPFDYVRKHHWEEWSSFIQNRKHLFRPKLLIDGDIAKC